MEDLNKIQVFANGKTVPEISSGSSILLIQNGTVEVGILNIGTPEEGDINIEHPSNSDELNPLAKCIIQESKPEYLNSNSSIIAICPTSISERFKWD